MKKLMAFRFSLLILLVIASGVAIFAMRMINLNVNPHGLCPYSFVCFGIPSWKGFFASNPFVIASSVGLAILVLTPFLGRLFCGWLCPLGAIQEVLFRLTNGKPKGKVKPNISETWHKRLSFFKYLVLFMNVILAFFLVQALYMNACPVIALSNIGNYLVIGAITLFIFVVSSLFVERFYCRYFCPLGALMNLIIKLGNFLKIPRIMIKVNKEKCVNCKLCSSNCPMQIDVERDSKVTDSDCILCQRCKTKCPVDTIDCSFCNEREKNE